MKYGDSSNSNRIDLFDQKDGALDMLRFKETQEEDDCYEIMDGEVDFDLGKEDLIYVLYCDENIPSDGAFNLQNEEELKTFNDLFLDSNIKVLIATRSLEVYNAVKESEYDPDESCSFESDRYYALICQKDSTVQITVIIANNPMTGPAYDNYTQEELKNLIQKDNNFISGKSNFWTNNIEWLAAAVVQSTKYTCVNPGQEEVRKVSTLCFDGFVCDDQIVAANACNALGKSYCKDGECVNVTELDCDTGHAIAILIQDQGDNFKLYDNKNCDNKPCVTQTPTPVPSESAP